MEARSPNDLFEAPALAPLETFDPRALLSDDRNEQEVCSFVLALALAYNDMKDCRWALGALGPYVAGNFQITPQHGQAWALYAHGLRRLYTVLHELMVLIKTHPKIINHVLFESTVSQLAKTDREIWLALAALANDSPRNNDLLKVLVRIRDNTASHYYGLKPLAEGYRAYFGPSNSNGRQPFISRGPNLAAARFYFADAAAQSYMEIASGNNLDGSADQIVDLTKVVAIALYQIVTRFIQKRSGGWYRVRTSG